MHAVLSLVGDIFHILTGKKQKANQICCDAFFCSSLSSSSLCLDSISAVLFCSSRT